MSKYLVTGVAGFIGSSIAHALLDQGASVRGIDNFSSGKPENLRDLQSLDFIEADICDPAACRQACREVDFVFHEAAIGSVPRSVKDPAASNESNVTGTLNLLLAARDASVRRVIYAGSSSVYGNTPTLPKHESMTPDPVSPYAVTKLAAEFYMRSFYRVYGVETVVIRYFNVFGPHQDPTSQYSGVLARFITAMLRGEQPTVFGDGEQSRDFTYIDNVVNANLLACAAAADRVAGRVFNVATGTRISLNETYKLLQQITGYKSSPIYGPERVGDVQHSLADITAARQAFEYVPSVDFKTGLEKTVAWYKLSEATHSRS